jgi:hypothetical protein
MASKFDHAHSTRFRRVANRYPLTVTYAYGGDVLNEDGSGYVYNSPATVEALTFLMGLLDDGCAFFLVTRPLTGALCVARRTKT